MTEKKGLAAKLGAGGLLLGGAVVVVLVAAVVTPLVAVLSVMGMSAACTPGGGSGSAGTVTSIEATGQRVWPLAEGTYQVSGEAGPRVNPVHGGSENHGGIDLAAPMGTPMYAAMDGNVVAAGPATGFGYWVVIDHNDDGDPVSTVYGHIQTQQDLRVNVGDKVHAGQVIGLVGSGGTSTGAHLHFEYVPGGRLQGNMPVNPREFLDKAKKLTAPGGDTDSDDAPPPTTDADPQLVADEGELEASDEDAGECGFGGAGGNLNPGAVPEEFVKWLQLAAKECPEFTAPLAGAQIKQEGNFQQHGANRAGASGYTQFIPGTWATWGYKVDDQGRKTGPPGGGDPNTIGDAVMAQARYMCAIFVNQKPLIESGQIKGDPVELALAGYNAGEGAVMQYGGVPPYAETQHYVKIIRKYEEEMSAPGGEGSFQPDPNGPLGEQIVAAAMSYRGQPYVWGGGDVNGPTTGIPHPQNPGGPGLDCSGLTTVAIYKASGGKITPPRSSGAQQQWTTPVPMDQIQPGDLLFSPGHVAIVVNDTTMIEAPTFGQSVTEAPIRGGMTAGRVKA